MLACKQLDAFSRQRMRRSLHLTRSVGQARLPPAAGALAQQPCQPPPLPSPAAGGPCRRSPAPSPRLTACAPPAEPRGAESLPALQDLAAWYGAGWARGLTSPSLEALGIWGAQAPPLHHYREAQLHLTRRAPASLARAARAAPRPSILNQH